MAASIDPHSNQVRQDILSLSDAMISLSTVGELPTLFLPTGLHEYTHHWCFSLPVGNALGALRQRANDMLLASDDFGEELFNAIFRYGAALRMLNPLLEGLAVFAEFESLPGASPSYPEIYGNVISMFGRSIILSSRSGSRDTASRVWNQFRHVLSGIRRTDDWLVKKQTLCFRPLFGDPAGAYLLGHIMFKALHRRAAARAPVLDDSESFLGWAAHSYFSDLTLACLLLDDSPEPSNFQWTRRLAERIVSRAGCFDLDDLQDRVNRYEQALLNGPTDATRLTVFAMTSGSPELFAEFGRRLSRFTGLPLDPLDRSEAAFYATWRMEARTLLRVAMGNGVAVQTAGGIEVDFGAATVVVERPRFVAAPPLPSRVSSVRVVLYFAPPSPLSNVPSWILAVHLSSGSLVGVDIQTKRDERSVVQEIRELAVSYLASLVAQDEMSAHGSLAAFVSEIWSDIDDEFQSMCASIVSDALDCDADGVSRCGELMSNFGVVGLVGDDDLARDLIQLSCARSADVFEPRLGEWLATDGIDLAELLRRLHDTGDRLGIELVRRRHDRSLDCVI